MCKICEQIQARVGKKGYPEWQDLARRVLTGELVPGMVDQKLADFYWAKFLPSFEAMWQDFPSPADSAVMRHTVIDNLRKATAAKVYNHIATLVDFAGSGATRLSEADFLPIAKRINKEWSVNYLATEVDLVEKSVQSINQWHGFKATKKALPNLKYITIGDDRVRPEHMALDGVVRPMDDPFWDIYFPPNGYGCRCDVIQTSEPVSSPGTFDLPEIRDEFMNNPGKTGQIFTQAHPYFQAIPSSEQDRFSNYFNLNLAA